MRDSEDCGSITGPEPLPLAVVQPSVRQSSYCTAIEALGDLVFRELAHRQVPTSTGPGGAQPNPDSITVSTVSVC
jgi:hypothetical protein